MLSDCWQAERGLSFLGPLQMPMNRAFLKRFALFRFFPKTSILFIFYRAAAQKFRVPSLSSSPTFANILALQNLQNRLKNFIFLFFPPPPALFADSHYGLSLKV
jgi:hypothetical protein